MASITIRLNPFDTGSIRNAIRRLQTQTRNQDQSVANACLRIAEYGARRAQAEFSSARYDGNNDVTVVAESSGTGARVRASGQAVLFIEYGAGALSGYGHPRPQGYGPGTYPGKGHWNDPNGWYYEHGKRSFGNAPTAAMYHAEQDMYYHAYEIANGEIKK